MDGVLADSEPVFLEGINAVIAASGKAMTPELHRSIMGTSVEDTWAILIRELSLPRAAADYISVYEGEMCRRLALVTTPLPGARELITALRQRGIPIRVASSSWPQWSGPPRRHRPARLLHTSLRPPRWRTPNPRPTSTSSPPPGSESTLPPASPSRTPRRDCAPPVAAGMYAVQVRASSTAFPPFPEADAVIETLADFDLGLLEHPAARNP